MTISDARIIDRIPTDSEFAAMAIDRESRDVAVLLPEQEWCEQCSYEEGPYDEDTAPGMPREVAERSVENDPMSQYEVTYLACGHTIDRLC